MAEDVTAPETSDVAPPTPRRRSRWAIALVGLLLVVLLLVGFAGSALWWALKSESGTAWVLARVPGVAVVAPRGALLGDFSADRITATWPAGSAAPKSSVSLLQTGWRGLRIARSPVDGVWLSVHLAELRATRIDLQLAPSPPSTTQPQPPTSLALPIELEIDAVRVGELHAAAVADKPLRAIAAHVHLGANGGAQHRLDELAVAWDTWQATGALHIGTRAEMALDARVELRQVPAAPGAAANFSPGAAASAASDAAASAPPAAASAPAASAANALPAISASATLTGPLQRPVLHATASVTPPAPRPPQSLQADATLQPFAPWPLAALRANLQALDLSALVPTLPVTALSGEATVESSGLDQPALVKLAIANAEAGRWSDARLPVRDLTLEVSVKPNDPGTLTLQALAATLGSAAHPGGTVQGQGRWGPNGEWQLDATLAALQAAALDERAPSMRLSGPVALKGSGFAGTDPDAATIAINADLRGSGFEASPVPGATMPPNAELKLDATLNPRRIDVRTLRAAVAGARAEASGVAERDDATVTLPPAPAAPAPRWKLKARAALKDFDPRPWWPGVEGSPWRAGPHRLNARLDGDVVVPATSMPAAELLAALRGHANATIDGSVLAGVPLAGQAALRSNGTGTATASVKLDAAGNTAAADGSFALNENSSGSGQADRLTLSVDAPALDRLAPLYGLMQVRGSTAALAGRLTAHAQVNGRWPTLTTTGDLNADALRTDAATVRHAQATWSLGTGADAKVDLQAAVDDTVLLSTPAPSSSAKRKAPTVADPAIESVRVKLQGTARDHRLDLQAIAKALPPEWLTAMQRSGLAAPDVENSTSDRTVASLQAQGGLIEAPASAASAPSASASASTSTPIWAGAAGWRGRIDQLLLQSGPAGTSPLLRARAVQLDAQWAGEAARLVVQPNRLELVGGATLAWTQLSWQAAASAGQPAQIDVEATLAPLHIAPLLTAVQPDFGWGGDLALSGHASIHSTTAFNADVVIERASGDLTVTDEAQTLPLGLTDLRLGLTANNGTWTFTQALAGRTIGVAAGALIARTSPQATMPPPDAPVEGVLQVNVADLGSLGPWLAPGWRLAGVLEAKATLAGRFGAPEYIGSVTGQKLGVRNFLQGVNVSDGDLAVSLRGATARIERFTARAGDGTVTVEGGAELGASPTAQLKLVASQFRVLGRVDRRIVASGQADLKLDAGSIALAGRFDVDQGLIDFSQADAPRLADDVDVVRGTERMLTAAQLEAQAAAKAAKAAETKRRVDLDLRLGLGKDLKLRGHGFATGLVGDLHLTAPGGRLTATGDIRTDGGTYNAYGQKLVVDKGVISFTGAVDNPRLDIEATRPKIDVRAGVAISGTAQNPRIRLFSEPDLSEVDKLSWLVMGRASDGLGRTETALVQRAALALLSGEGEGTTDKVTKAIGLDEFSIGGGEGGDVRSSVISVGKQISERWYVGYEQGLTATGGSFQLIYRLAQRFTLRAQSGSDNSVDGIWTWRWK